MIISLTDTTTHEINDQLLRQRESAGSVALGRVLTLVIDAGDSSPEASIEAADSASHESPCRIIALSRQAGLGDSLNAKIHIGEHESASDVIVLSHDLADDTRLETLIFPLLLPDAPVVAWWPYEPPAHPSEHPIGRIARRRITSTRECDQPSERLRALARSYTAGDTDLAWARSTLWRGLIASALDGLATDAVQRITISGKGPSSTFDILAAWLHMKLECPVRIELDATAIALQKVTLTLSSGEIVLDREGGEIVRLYQPDEPALEIPLPVRSLEECLAEELRHLDADDVYGEALKVLINDDSFGGLQGQAS